MGERVTHDDAHAPCGDCGHDLDLQWFRRGRAFQCPQCQSWLYRGLWSKKYDENRCLSCRQPKSGERCVFCCADDPPGLWQKTLDWMSDAAKPAQRCEWFPIARIRVDVKQARLSVDLHEFERLCRSIDELGMIQPILVRSCGDHQDPILVSGHRRLLAARHLGWRKVPVAKMHLTELQAIQVRLAENTQREAVIALEVADSLEYLAHETDTHGAEELSQISGLSEETTGKCLELLTLTEEERERIVYGFEESRVPGLPGNSTLGGTVRESSLSSPAESAPDVPADSEAIQSPSQSDPEDPQYEHQQLLQTLTRLQKRNRELESERRRQMARLQADQLELAHQIEVAEDDRRRIFQEAEETRAQLAAERATMEAELDRREREVESRRIQLEKEIAKQE